ncbi:MAG: hypothetical protein FJZ87_16140 [Chloroflexi bacterium]|nr:hypothetical protein [Chloroflexota bacterium]
MSDRSEQLNRIANRRESHAAIFIGPVTFKYTTSQKSGRCAIQSLIHHVRSAASAEDRHHREFWTGASSEVKAAKHTTRGIMINLGMDISVNG